MILSTPNLVNKLPLFPAILKLFGLLIQHTPRLHLPMLVLNILLVFKHCLKWSNLWPEWHCTMHITNIRYQCFLNNLLSSGWIIPLQKVYEICTGHLINLRMTESRYPGFWFGVWKATQRRLLGWKYSWVTVFGNAMGKVWTYYLRYCLVY